MAALNRRNALAAIAATAIAMPAAASLRPNSARSDRRAWDRAMAAYRQALARSDAYEAEFDRISTKYCQAVDQVPHVTVSGSGYGYPLTTANPDIVDRVRSSAKSLRYVEICAFDDVKARQQFLDAADARDVLIATIDNRIGWTRAGQHYDKLSDGIADAEKVLLNLPAPDGDAVLWKVNRLYEPGSGMWADGVEDQTIADLNRFLLPGRA